MAKCEHCHVDKDEIVPKEEFKRRIAEKTEKIADLTGEIKAKTALVEQAEGRVKAAQAQIAELAPLRERVEAMDRNEMLTNAGIPADKLADGKVSKRIKREYDAHVAEMKDDGKEAQPFAEWLAAEDGARSDVLLAPLFAKAAEPVPAPPPAVKDAPRAAPKPATGPPAAPPATATTPAAPRSAEDIRADPVYKGHYAAAEAARAANNHAAAAEATGKARARLAELRANASQPVAT